MKMSKYGCRYCKMDTMRQVEYCTLTGELTNAKPECDFLYERCPEYQNATSLRKKVKDIATNALKSKPEPKRAPQLMQTSIFGAAGEKPFEVV